MGVLQPMQFSEQPERVPIWVDATPFRAHLGQLLATGLTEPVVARLAGMSVRAVQHLAHGRHGRPVRRICDDAARRLLQITTREARAIRFRPVHVRASRYRVRTMMAAGRSADRLADDLGIGVSDLLQVLGPGPATCTELIALTIAAAYEQWETEQEFPGLYAAVA